MIPLGRSEIAQLRGALAEGKAAGAIDDALLARLLDHADFALACSAVLARLQELDVEPYGDSARMQKAIVDEINRLWNSYLV